MGKFDAMELQVDKPAKLTILHPVTRQPLRDTHDESNIIVAFVELFSADSLVARKHNRSIQRRRLDMRGRGKITPEQLEAEAIEMLAALTTNWALVGLDGKALSIEFNAENARELYASEKLSWLREQVDEFASDRANFSAAS